MTDYPAVTGVVTAQNTDISALCMGVAESEGMPAQVLVAGGIAESNLDEHAERYGAWPDVSFGCWQQTVAYAPIGDQSASQENIAYVREQLFNVNTACNIAAPQYGTYWRSYGQHAATYDDGLRETLGRYNWPSRGYSGNPNAGNIDRAVRASWAYVQGASPAPPPADGLVYDAFISPERQTYDWTCSANSAYWALRSVGVAVPPKDEFVYRMVDAGLISEALGLLDGSGAALADWLSATYGVDARAVGAVSWEWQHAGHCGYGPVMAGSHRAYHWVAMKWMATPTLMAIMNPAPNWQGIGDELTEDEYNSWAPWQAIWIPATPVTMTPPPAEDELSQAEKEELEYLRNWYEQAKGPWASKIHEESAKGQAAEDGAAKNEALLQCQFVADTLERG